MSVNGVKSALNHERLSVDTYDSAAAARFFVSCMARYFEVSCFEVRCFMAFCLEQHLLVLC
jgi:hypothetical protein